MQLIVEDLMVRDVVTINDEYSVKYASRMMSYFNISSLVVTSSDKVTGILTEKDIMTRIVAKGLDPEKVTVRDIMSKPVLVVNPTTLLEDAVETMIQKKIKKLPVMSDRGEDSELLGMLSITDVARIQPLIIDSLRSVVQIEPEVPEVDNSYYIR